MSITPLPAPPSTGSPSTFSADADAFLGAMPTFQAELNATASAFALSVSATSTTSLAIGLGPASLTVQAGKGFLVGQTVVIASTVTPTNQMAGIVTSYDSGTGAMTVSVSSIGGTGTLAAWTVGLVGLVSVVSALTPGGRLTLTTATPVTTGAVSGASTVYYSPYRGGYVQIYDGAQYVVTSFTELSQATTDATKSPAAVANNSNYDMFVWNDSGTIRCTRGPPWTSDTGRGTGAGTTELQMVQGVITNKAAITNGPSAGLGTYVGTIRSNGTATIDDTLTKRMVWNAYNAESRPLLRTDATASWTYASTTIRQANANAANKVEMIIGLDIRPIEARVLVGLSTQNAGTALPSTAGLGLDSITSFSGLRSDSDTYSAAYHLGPNIGEFFGYVGIGYHYLSWNESGNTNAVFYGTSGNTLSGIIGSTEQ